MTTTGRVRFHRLADERGQSLVMALLLLTFLAISLGTVIFFTAGNQSTANLQKAQATAASLAEAGVNNAVSIMANPANANSLTLSSLMPSSATTAYSKAYVGGTVKWWGTCDNSCGFGSGWLWTLHGQGTVLNPTGAAPIVKTMTAQVQVHQPPPNKIDLAVWNSIYSPYGPTSTCDTTVPQGVTISVPLYVGGNLCVAQSGAVLAPIYVGGWLQIPNPQGNVGTSSAPINSAHVGSSCQYKNFPTVNPCKSEPTSPKTNLWVNNPTSWNPKGLPPDFIDPVTGQLITAPTICWAASSNCTGDLVGGWYNAASPGPMHPCTTVSGTPPVFDNDTQWGPDENQPGGSVAGTFNLTPTQPYTCKTNQGELSWSPTTRTLTVVGTVFIDGSVTATTIGNTPITYAGSGSCTTTNPCDGVIYATGTVYITSEKLCAVLNAGGTDCNWTTWDPNTKILTFLANYQGTQQGVGAGQGIVVGPSQTSFQGALYANYQIATGQGAATQGPLVSGTQTVVMGQQFQGSFPQIKLLPTSIQGPPQGFWISPPMNFKYGG